MVGLNPDTMFTHLDKYQIKVDKMPRFSNIFERAEPMMPGLGMTVAGSLLTAN